MFCQCCTYIISISMCISVTSVCRNIYNIFMYAYICVHIRLCCAMIFIDRYIYCLQRQLSPWEGVHVFISTQSFAADQWPKSKWFYCEFITWNKQPYFLNIPPTTNEVWFSLRGSPNLRGQTFPLRGHGACEGWRAFWGGQLKSGRGGHHHLPWRVFSCFFRLPIWMVRNEEFSCIGPKLIHVEWF